MEFECFGGSKIKVTFLNDQVLIKANTEGLKSLANSLIALSESMVKGAHFHLDEFNSLEPGSIEVIFEKNFLLFILY
jgi:hypothetical protein